MSWATLTLMDIDCGRTTGLNEDCEVIVSADHSEYQAGGNVAVTFGEDGAATFKDMIVSGAENNPHNIILNGEQKALAVALSFENTDHFTLDMLNDAGYPRTFLVAGITNIQWPNMEPPPIKLIPQTVPPTPWPTPAPVSTLFPTPSPTCPFTAVSGSCVVTCTCVSSPNYPQNYAANDACVIGVARPTPLITKDFSTEAFWDTLQVNGKSFSGTDGPENVVAEGTISWKADKQDQDKGWQLCADIPETVPTPSTSSPTSSVQTTEPCEFSGALCVQSPNYPVDYGNYQTCSIRFPSGTLHVNDFFTETLYDTLTVDGVSFSGQTGPDGVEVSASSVIVWSSDWGTTHTGWRMCAEPPATTTAPTEEVLNRPRSVPLMFDLPSVTNEHPWLLMLCGITGIVGGLGILGCVLKGCGAVTHFEDGSSSESN
uniref:CUB domain-containing protein n=1 Tax=Noctiluca scintillans TaxID=2966 RepID=A0A7S1FE65_NOCSC